MQTAEACHSSAPGYADLTAAHSVGCPDVALALNYPTGASGHRSLRLDPVYPLIAHVGPAQLADCLGAA
jgi:hypothetical protein